MRKQRQPGGGAHQDALALILGVVALFLIVVFYLSASWTGPLGIWVRQFCRGLMGPLAYLLPLFFWVGALVTGFPEGLSWWRKRILHLLVILCICVSLGHLFSVPNTLWNTLQREGAQTPLASKFLLHLFQVSGNPESYPAFASTYPAGLLLGLPTIGLSTLMGKVGAALFGILALLLESLQVFGGSWKRILVGSFQYWQEQRRQARMVRQSQSDFSQREESKATREQMDLDDVLPFSTSAEMSREAVEDPGIAASCNRTGGIFRARTPSEPDLSTVQRGEPLRLEPDRKDPADYSFPEPMQNHSPEVSIRSGFSPAMDSAPPQIRPVLVEPVNPNGFSLPSFLRRKSELPAPFSEDSLQEEGEEEYVQPVRISDLISHPMEVKQFSENQEQEPTESEEGAQQESVLHTSLPAQGEWVQQDETAPILSSVTEEEGDLTLSDDEQVGLSSLPFSVEHPGMEDSFEEPERGDEEQTFTEDAETEQIERAESLLKPVQNQPYQFPPLSLLKPETSAASDSSQHEKIRGMAQRLETTLKSFGVDAKVMHVSYGPAITRFELAPAPGVKVSKILNLSDDIALSLAALSVRIEAPIPGKSAIGIEIPNAEIQTVGLREILEDPRFSQSSAPLLVGLGRDIPGQPVLCDLRKMPHLLIAGATGSGKSVCINCILMSILFHAHPDEVKLLMVDPKVVELKMFNGIPHLLAPVVTDPKKAANLLNWAVNEMDRRYRMFSDANVRDYNGYKQVAKERDLERIPLILIVIDELADLMVTCAKEVEESIARLSAMARAAGIHLLVATQRPSVDVITGVIKANVPSRIAFAVSSQVDSRTIIDGAGAEKLLGRGDMLYRPVDQNKSLRAQGAFVSDSEVEQVIAFLKAQNYRSMDADLAKQIETASATAPGKEKGQEAEDELFDQAVEIALDANYASVSLFQRRLNIGYPRAARLVDALERAGFIGPFEGSKPRTLRITRAQWQAAKQQEEEGSYES